ncbi:2'-5' RNA ligase [Photobacterium aquae]|uniref:2'-5' RNA ligase n=1 Tax=Photobacterium aquae TaxID=1195763 RepID=A0A0J1H032_9GAMM|nr:RNA ligase family protein [Photobacterium aquae]KLV05181.1 2'-5' RNA ligase [Photobacterium aquae]
MIRYKYPRTPHLPWSPGATSDDIRCIDTNMFVGRRVVVTEKMDGENSTLYRDFVHARSLDSINHPSRDWLKCFHAMIGYDIPIGWRVCGENMYARHSICYSALKSYFYGFSIWDDNNQCLSWADTLTWFDLLGITSPPVIYRGIWDEEVIRQFQLDTKHVEGYVVRLEDSFYFDDFRMSVAKWVRKNHVQTETHWMHKVIVPNGLCDIEGASK